MRSELKPCPFCGGECRVLVSGSKALSHWFNVYCTKCDAQNQQRQTAHDAITAWNTRTVPMHGGDLHDQVVALILHLERHASMGGNTIHDVAERVIAACRTPDTSAKVDVEGFRRELNDLIVWCVNTRDLVPPTAQQMRYERAIRLCERLISALQPPRSDTSAVDLVREILSGLKLCRPAHVTYPMEQKIERWLKKQEA